MEAGKGPLASALAPTDGPFDLLVCNPPFFGSVEEQRTCCKASADEQVDVTADVAAAGGAVPNPHEAVCCGGEEQFLTTLLTDSLALGADRVRWYVRAGPSGCRVPTSRVQANLAHSVVQPRPRSSPRYAVLVGKKATLKTMVGRMHAAGVTNIRTTRFFQGYTVRWGLAWSLTADGCDARGRPPADALLNVKTSKLKGLPLKSFEVASLGGDGEAPTVSAVLLRVRTFLSEYRDLSVRSFCRCSERETETERESSEWAVRVLWMQPWLVSGTAWSRRGEQPQRSEALEGGCSRI